MFSSDFNWKGNDGTSILQNILPLESDFLAKNQIPTTRTPTGKRPLGRPRRRWEGNIRMHLEEIGINTRNWVDSAQDRDYWRALVNAALNFRVL